MQPRGFKDLFLIDHWAGSIALVIAGLVVSFFAFGFWWPYWRIADMDFWMVYEAFLFNDGLPQEWFVHPGYLTMLLLGAWFRLLHWLGFLHVHALSALPAPADAGDAWTAAVRAGRLLSLALACAFVLSFGALLLRLTRDRRVAVLGTFALAFSGGLAMHARVIRTELLSAALVTVALLILLIAARTPRTGWRPVLVGLAAFLSTLALINKVQFIVLICAIPLIVLPFGTRSDDAGGFWRTSPLAFPAAVLLAAGAILLVISAAPLVRFGLTAADTSVVPWRPVAGRFGAYQPFIAAEIVLAMLGFAVLWRVPRLEALAALAAAAGGGALGLLSLDVRFNPQNLLEAINPLEQLSYWAAASDPHLEGNILGSALIRSLIEGVGGVLARRTFILQSSPRPTIFLEWFVIAATVFALKRGQRKLAIQVAMLMGVVWGVDTIGTLRGLKLEYFILTDPLVILAAALLLAELADLQTHRFAFAIGVALIASHILVSQAEPVKHSFQRSKPLEFCVEHFEFTKRIERFSYCPPPPV
jgi:hypothetical protein